MTASSERLAVSSKKTGENRMFRKLLFCLPLTLLLLTVAEAQQLKKVHRIGYLATSDPARDIRSQAIRRALRDLGYIEGQNIAFEYRYAEGKSDRFPRLAAELARLKVDIILVAGGDALVRAAKDATDRIPIVMTGVGSDPVALGVVKSLARPGGNITGVTNLDRELGAKRLELLKEAVPRLHASRFSTIGPSRKAYAR
jgi:putative ABC transport system substrate-binding protein